MLRVAFLCMNVFMFVYWLVSPFWLKPFYSLCLMAVNCDWCFGCCSSFYETHGKLFCWYMPGHVHVRRWSLHSELACSYFSQCLFILFSPISNMDFRGFHLCCMCVPHAFSLVFTAAQWGTAPYNFWYNYVCVGSLAARRVLCLIALTIGWQGWYKHLPWPTSWAPFDTLIIVPTARWVICLLALSSCRHEVKFICVLYII